MNITEKTINFLKSLISIPSTKGIPVDGAPFGIETVNALNCILSKAEEFGFKTKNLDGYAGYIDFGDGEKQVAALCHLDIVPPGDGWTADPYILRSIDGKLIGRGISDDKGPAAICLYAMKELKDSGWRPKNKIRLILGLDEESGCECMEYYKSKEKVPDIGFTPDAKFPVIFAEKGILHVKMSGIIKSEKPVININLKGGDKANMVPSVSSFSLSEIPGIENIINETIFGKSAHASTPDYGKNAISIGLKKISSILASYDAHHPFICFFEEFFNGETNGKSLNIAFEDESSGALTCNVGLLSVDGLQVSMTLDIRYPVTASKDEIMTKLSNAGDKYGLNTEILDHMEPLFRSPEDEFIQTLLRVYNTATGKNDSPIAIGGGTYARRVPNIIAFGPVFNVKDDVAHQADEYMRIDDLKACLNIYKQAFIELDGLL